MILCYVLMKREIKKYEQERIEKKRKTTFPLYPAPALPPDTREKMTSDTKKMPKTKNEELSGNI